MLQGHRCADFEGVAHHVGPGSELVPAVLLLLLIVAEEAQHAAAEEQEVEHQRRRDELGNASSQGGSHDTEADDVDKEVVEQHVQDAHQDVQHRRNLHVARALEHRAGQALQLEEDAAHADDGEIQRGIGGYLRRAAQPVGQGTADEEPGDGEHEAERHAAHQRLPQDAPRTLEVVGADGVGHLDGEFHVDCRPQTAHQPRGGLHKTDGSRRLGAEVTHHGGVDEEHDGGRELRQNGRNAEADYQSQLLALRHRAPFADVRQQVGLLVLLGVHGFCGLQNYNLFRIFSYLFAQN